MKGIKLKFRVLARIIYTPAYSIISSQKSKKFSGRKIIKNLVFKAMMFVSLIPSLRLFHISLGMKYSHCVVDSA